MKMTTSLSMVWYRRSLVVEVPVIVRPIIVWS